MEKINLFLLALTLLVACSGGDASPEKIKASIEEKKVQVETLEQEIQELEVQLKQVAGNDEKEKPLVETQEINYQAFSHYISVNGNMEAVNEAYISPEMGGQIQAIHVKIGQRVHKGQLLVSLSSDVIETSIAEVKTNLELVTALFEKQKDLWEQKIGSEVQFLQAKSNKESLESRLKNLKAQLAKTRITAPIKGIIDDITQKEGEMASPGFQLVKLVNLDEMYVNAAVSEVYLSKVSVGDSIEVEVPSYPDLKIKSTIHHVGNIINTQNRTFALKVKLKNQQEKFKPNLMAVLHINDFSTDSALLVPLILVKQDFNGSYIFIAEKENGKYIARKKYIETGMSDDKNIIVSKNLKAGNAIIVNGYNLVRDGQEIEIN